MIDLSMDYLRLLGKSYPTIRSASREVINLSAILQLPKGTEHFLSDVHGEDEAFAHVLRNGSGSVRRKIEQVFGTTLMEVEKKELATLIYYPRGKMSHLLKSVPNRSEWYRIMLFRLVKVLRLAASKYTRSRVRRFMPRDFSYVMEELLHEEEEAENKQAYYRSILDTIISTGQAKAFIVALAEMIQKLVIAHLHVIGDIYDRGPGAHLIMDMLMNHHDVDVQWGNHDMLWMGAAAGCEASIANVIRISLRYANMKTLESGYGISLLPLATFAMKYYDDDEALKGFEPRGLEGEKYTVEERRMLAAMQRAILMIQLKLEGQLVKRRPEFKMEDRLLLHQIDVAAGTVKVDGQTVALNSTFFPTVDFDKDPYALTDEEQGVMSQLVNSFQMSENLQEHVRFLFAKGSMYLVFNDRLLYHGCIPMTESGQFKEFTLGGVKSSGRDYLDHVEMLARQGYFADEGSEKRLLGQDVMLYLWSGSKSPLFGKNKMATFESYFIDDPAYKREQKNPYYQFRDDEAACLRILKEFGLESERALIVNGHVPVRVKKGESPLKANGRLLVIDGGFSRAYQPQTGIAGYTLVSNSHGLMLCAHEPFESREHAVLEEADIHSSTRFIVREPVRLRVKDTVPGRYMQKKIEQLQALIEAYRSGLLKEQESLG